MDSLNQLIRIVENEGIELMFKPNFPSCLLFIDSSVYIVIKAGLEKENTIRILGHELGHYFLNHKARRKVKNLFEVDDNLENEADYFSKLIVDIARTRLITDEDIKKIIQEVLVNE